MIDVEKEIRTFKSILSNTGSKPNTIKNHAHRVKKLLIFFSKFRDSLVKVESQDFNKFFIQNTMSKSSYNLYKSSINIFFINVYNNSKFSEGISSLDNNFFDNKPLKKFTPKRYIKVYGYNINTGDIEVKNIYEDNVICFGYYHKFYYKNPYVVVLKHHMKLYIKTKDNAHIVNIESRFYKPLRYMLEKTKNVILVNMSIQKRYVLNSYKKTFEFKDFIVKDKRIKSRESLNNLKYAKKNN